MNQQRISRVILNGLVMVLLLLHVSGAVNFSFLQRLEDFAYDLRLNLTLPHTIDKRIVIVDIDEKSLASIGQWPWPRSIIADLTDSLYEHYKVQVFGYDVVFAEPDDLSAIDLLNDLKRSALGDNPVFIQEYNRRISALDTDADFAKSLKKHQPVLGYTFRITDTEKASGALPDPILVLSDALNARLYLTPAQSYTGNLALLQNATSSAGFFSNELLDSDGVFRRALMIQQYDGAFYQSLSLAVVRQVLGNPPLETLVAPGGDNYASIESVSFDGISIPLDHSGSALIPYLGYQGSFPYVSASDVINHKVEKDILDGAIVLLGTTAQGLLDLRATPMQTVYPGVEVHANLISGILDNRILSQPSYTIGLEFLTIIFLGLALSALLPRLGPSQATTMAVVVLSAIVSSNLLFWNYGQLVLPLANVIVLVFALFTLHMSLGFFVENRGKRQLSKMFGQYIPPELVEEMNANLDKDTMALEGDSREMTVCFSDIRNFTSISEKLSPTELSSLLNAYLSPMTEVIHQHRGTIDKYMGDAIMAFWGAPLRDPLHAELALEAAMAMQIRLAALRSEFEARDLPPLHMGVGLACGEMNVGNMGSSFRMAYTVMGDTVNLGSRLEGLTKVYGTEIIVNDQLRDAVPSYVFQELDKVRVKGKDQPIAIYQPIVRRDLLDKSTAQALTQYKIALKSYRNQQWDKAELDFFNLSKADPKNQLYKIYLQRIPQHRRNPPAANWDGVYQFTTK